MSAVTPDPRQNNNPTPDDLAGTPVCKEEDHPVIRLLQLGEKQKHGGSAPPQQHRLPMSWQECLFPRTVR